MAYETILWDIKAGVGTLTLNRPEVYNSFNDAMSFEVQAALKEAGRDSGVRCVVLTGAGKAFCSGQDLGGRYDNSDEVLHLGDSVRQRYNPIILALRGLNKPVIAAVNGVAAGAGCALALACDLRVASSKASFIQAFVRIGAAPDSGATFFLPRLVGLGRAAEMLYLGEKVGAEQACNWGLVNRVVEPDALMAYVEAMVLQLVAGPTAAIALAKRALNQALASDLETLLAYEAHMQEIAGQGAEFREGVAAFMEKRPAQFAPQ
jgi:2-(1,2-epoxy-1,2-dihydrophenyl)acetyl-CoA isomerase